MKLISLFLLLLMFPSYAEYMGPPSTQWEINCNLNKSKYKYKRLSSYKVTVNTAQDDVEMFVDNDKHGKADRTLMFFHGNLEHRIHLFKDGYQDTIVSIVNDDVDKESITLEITLTKEKLENGTGIINLVIGTQPEGAEVTIDGKYIGTSNLFTEISKGKHQIHLSMLYYCDTSLMINVVNETSVFDIRLYETPRNKYVASNYRDYNFAIGVSNLTNRFNPGLTFTKTFGNFVKGTYNLSKVDTSYYNYVDLDLFYKGVLFDNLQAGIYSRYFINGFELEQSFGYGVTTSYKLTKLPIEFQLQYAFNNFDNKRVDRLKLSINYWMKFVLYHGY